MAPIVDLMLLLDQASHALTTELTAGLASVGITPRGHCVLYHALSGDLTQGQLAERCALDKTTMVVTLDELEKSGLARRHLSSSDRRARIVEVTERGMRVVDEAQRVVDRVYADVLEALPARERSSFVAGLSRLVGAGGRLASAVQCERPVRRRRARAVPALVR
jgi:MarR family transcriptional regulator, transcriptional regulator for hemolysin